LRECREAMNLSQGQVAEMLDCSQQFVSGIEQGREKITIDYLRRFAAKTGCDFDLILRSPRQAHTEETKVSENYAELKGWVERERRAAREVAKTQQRDKCLMEVVAYLPDSVVNAQQDAWKTAAGQVPEETLQFRQDELRRAMEQTQVHSFGWPIGLVMTRPEYAPKPHDDGIRATILTDGLMDRSSFDYWALRTDRVFYLLKTLFEDERSEGKIFVDTRIVRTAETLLRISRLYRALHVTPKERVVIRIHYIGLRNRVLSFADPARTMRHDGVCVENESEAWIKERLKNIEPKLVDLVYTAVSELCTLFDYFPLSKEQAVRPLVERFLQENAEQPNA
ncbi:MAG: helix-turn-helix transcriptional regulator, partial [Candidatus Omnitrophica bacterium]|nr:helix-turn-helix transcriptional regulator [Candidatus Omnitrophota bacterium]